MEKRLTDREARTIADAVRHVRDRYQRCIDALPDSVTDVERQTMLDDRDTETQDAIFLAGRRSGFRLGMMIVGIFASDDFADEVIESLQDHD